MEKTGPTVPGNKNEKRRHAKTKDEVDLVQARLVSRPARLQTWLNRQGIVNNEGMAAQGQWPETDMSLRQWAWQGGGRQICINNSSNLEHQQTKRIVQNGGSAHLVLATHRSREYPQTNKARAPWYFVPVAK